MSNQLEYPTVLDAHMTYTAMQQQIHASPDLKRLAGSVDVQHAIGLLKASQMRLSNQANKRQPYNNFKINYDDLLK